VGPLGRTSARLPHTCYVYAMYAGYTYILNYFSSKMELPCHPGCLHAATSRRSSTANDEDALDNFATHLLLMPRQPELHYTAERGDPGYGGDSHPG